MEMTKTKIILYDVKTRVPNVSTSLNVWRARLVLNYKKLDYGTIWLDGPDIAQSHIAAGIPPTDKHDDGSPRYTVPAIIDLTRPEAPVKLSDSRIIIDYLERTYPEADPGRSLFPPNTRAFQTLAFHYFLERYFSLVFPLMMLKAEALQTDGTRIMFRTIYEPKFGKTIEEMVPTGKDREEAWKKVRDVFTLLGSCVEESQRDDDSPFFIDRNPCFLDFHVASALFVMRLVLGDEFERELGGCANGRWIRLLDAFSSITKL